MLNFRTPSEARKSKVVSAIGFYFLLILIVSLLKGRTVINRFIREEVQSGAYEHAVVPLRPAPPRA